MNILLNWKLMLFNTSLYNFLSYYLFTIAWSAGLELTIISSMVAYIKINNLMNELRKLSLLQLIFRFVLIHIHIYSIITWDIYFIILSLIIDFKIYKLLFVIIMKTSLHFFELIIGEISFKINMLINKIIANDKEIEEKLIEYRLIM